MSTTAKLTGWVQGRNHAPTPIEITGHPVPFRPTVEIPFEMLRDVRVNCYFPALKPPEVSFHLDELPRGDFEIGAAVEITLAEVKPQAQAQATLDVVAAAEAARADVLASQATVDGPVVTTPGAPLVVTTGPVVGDTTATVVSSGTSTVSNAGDGL